MLFKHRAQASLGIVETAHSGESLKNRHVKPHVDAETLRVAVGIRIVARQAAAKRKILRGTGRESRQEAVFCLHHAVLGGQAVDSAAAHIYVVGMRIIYAAVETPCTVLSKGRHRQRHGGKGCDYRFHGLFDYFVATQTCE